MTQITIRRGFTLIELIVVVTIISFLAAILLNRIPLYQEAAEKTAMEQTVGVIRSALH
ncbi:MAG: type II secretion system protein, partial [Burkholderiales bacterium]